MNYLDKRFKELGHDNVSMPMLIPESLLQKEKDHVEGFAPECAWVTMGGSEELPERLCIRPTSETLFCDHWSHVVHSWRDLPMKYNQWCSVLRWEKTTRPFLRGREFLWQEGHTLHATAEEAIEETEQMLEVYADCLENLLAMPVVRGNKTDKEKFAGAERTYTVECMMHDHKALQSGTSHYFGDGFAKAFGIAFSDKENKLQTPHETSWGMSTRTIGGLIMTHGDNNGLVLPPHVAPIQVIIVPVAQHKEGVLEKAGELYDTLKAAGIRVKMDDVAVRRDNREKVTINIDELAASVSQVLEQVQQGLFDKAKKNLEEHTKECETLEDVKTFIETEGGFAKTKWCGDLQCELDMKEKAGVSSRCMPLSQSGTKGKCVCCGKECTTDILWGVAY